MCNQLQMARQVTLQRVKRLLNFPLQFLEAQKEPIEVVKTLTWEVQAGGMGMTI